MTTSNRREEATEEILSEYIKEVEATVDQVNQLIKTIQENRIDLIQSKAEIKFVIESVKELSSIIRDETGKGSLLTRLALLERELEKIRTYIEKDTEADNVIATRITILEQQVHNLIEKNTNNKKESSPEGKWKLYIAIATGIFTVLGTAIAMLLETGC